jgi:pyruvate formate lyase activating enzyme
MPPDKCRYCAHHCLIPAGGFGRCGRYRGSEGVVVEAFPDSYLARYPTAVETVPFLHFWPGHTFYAVSSVGCNLACPGCVSAILTADPALLSGVLVRRSPAEVVGEAKTAGCRGITFCLNEPAVSLPTVLRLAEAAHDAGLLFGCSTNGYLGTDALRALAPLLDAVNVGLKGASDACYRECGAASAGPAYRAISHFHDAGVHVEVSVVYQRGREDEVVSAAEKVAARDPGIPFQIMRFMPFSGGGREREPSAREAEDLAATVSPLLDHVYLFNTPGTEYLNTVCPACGRILIRRAFNGPMGARNEWVHPGTRCECGVRVPVSGQIISGWRPEPRFAGGYRPTRGLEVIRGMLAAAGVTDRATQGRVLAAELAGGGLSTLHTRIATPPGFCSALRSYSAAGGRPDEGELLSSCLLAIVSGIRNTTIGMGRPRVYAALGHPLVPLFADKPAISIISSAGGYPVNCNLDRSDRDARSVPAREIEVLRPEVVFYQAVAPVDTATFIRACLDTGVLAEAVGRGAVYRFPAGEKTGCLGWVASIAAVAGILHPAAGCPTPEEVEDAVLSCVGAVGGEII